MALKQRTETETIYLSPETPGKHKANSRLVVVATSSLAPALLACMVPALVAYGLDGATFAAALVAACLSAGALGAASSLLQSKRLAGYAAFAIALASVALSLALPPAREGLFALYNGIVFRFDEVFSAYVGLVGSGNLMATSPLFGVCLGALAGAASWAFTRLHTTNITLLVVVILCAGALRLQTGFGIAAAVLGSCAWLTQCRLTILRGSSYPLYHMVLSVAVNVLCCVAVFVGINALWAPNATVANFHNGVESTIEKARYGSDTLPEGDLHEAKSMNEGDETRLSLSAEGQVSDNLLLHGFMGATFENGSWQPLTHTAYEGEWKGVMPWLQKQGLTPAEQRAAYDTESANAGGEATSTATLSVNASGANAKYVYTPYTLRSLNGAASLDLDGSALSGIVGTRSYSFTMDNVAPANVFADANWLAQSNSSYASTESVYAAFARAHYLDVSGEEKEAIDQLIFNGDTWNASASSSEYAVISRVRTMMETLASYSETPDAPATDTPFTQWFLGEAREGNSAYFATAAALALRSQGIPARYVEGYRAEADALADAARANTPLQLSAQDAHAWVEVYLNGIGWTPIEVTPGFYAQSLNPDQIIDVNEAHSNGSGDIMQSESVMGQIDDDEQDNQESPIQQVINVASNVLLVLVMLLVAVVALEVQRHARIAYRKHLEASDDQAVSVPALYRSLSAMMQETGLHFDQTRPLDCLGEFEETFPGIAADEYRRVVNLHQAYSFGAHKLKPNEMRTLRRFTQRIHAALPKPQTFTKRFKRYFVKAL